METLIIIVITLLIVLALAVYALPLLSWQGAADFFLSTGNYERERSLMALRDLHLDHEQGKISKEELELFAKDLVARSLPEKNSGRECCPACGYALKEEKACLRCGQLL
ncbi:MAG: hypothetical protein HS115_06285 [Spirochaetales bacterium]|nr:hypothetical protein [Spirochaetales bacterium]